MKTQNTNTSAPLYPKLKKLAVTTALGVSLSLLSCSDKGDSQTTPETKEPALPEKHQGQPTTTTKPKLPENQPPAKKGSTSNTLDTDKDGVPDKVDKCPKTPGSKHNGGCPMLRGVIARPRHP